MAESALKNADRVNPALLDKNIGVSNLKRAQQDLCAVENVGRMLKEELVASGKEGLAFGAVDEKSLRAAESATDALCNRKAVVRLNDPRALNDLYDLVGCGLGQLLR